MRLGEKGLVCSFALALLVVSNLYTMAARAAGIGVSASSLDFGSASVNTASSPSAVILTNNSKQSMTIVQASSNLSEFILTGPSLPLTLAPRQSAIFQVVFQPDSGSSFSGSLTFTFKPTRWGLITIPLTGTGIGSSASPSSSGASYLLSANTNTLNFGNVPVGNLSWLNAILTNTGNSSVSISQVNVTGASFSASGISLPLSLAAGQSVSLSIAFVPSAAGSAIGSVSAVSNATNSPVTISLSGAGTQPQISLVPMSVDFGNVILGIANTQTMTLTNPGSANLGITQTTLSGAGFALSGLTLPLTVAPGQSTQFTVSFAPTTATRVTGSLSLLCNAPNSPLVVVLSGTGVTPVLQLSASPSSLSFGNATVGSSSTQTVTLTNTGNSSVSVSQVNVTGSSFTFSGLALPVTLSPGQAASFSVAFAPTTSGSLTGSISVVSNASNSPAMVSLSGSGAQTLTHSVTLDWTASKSTVVGYNVYRGTQAGGPYTMLNSTPVTASPYTDSVQSGQTYYYVATAVDSNGVESAYSNEVSATIP